MKTHLKRLLSGLLSTMMVISTIPFVSAHAEEKAELYPYAMFAASDAEGAISINTDGFCANASIATNGTYLTTAQFVNGGYSCTENCNLPMINAHYAVLDEYFSDAIIFTDDVVLSEMNNNIVDSVGTDFSFSATGNVSLSGSVGAIYDLSFYKGEYGANINDSNSVMYSRVGDITVDCNSFSFGGLIYAPNGHVSICAENVNLNGLIIADSIEITGSNVNLNYNQSFARLIGSCMNNPSESIENDTRFEVEKNIILNTTYLSYMEDGYDVEDGFEELNGTLLMSSMFESLTIEVFDDHGINVFSEDIPPSLNWTTTNLGLLCGDNYVKVTALDANGEILQKEYLLHCSNADFNDGLMIDRNDDDSDGLINYIENYFGTNTDVADTDSDGLTDYQEIYDTSTNPLLWDTDENGIRDGDEDNDCDGLDNKSEYIAGSYAYIADSDMDGISDYDEYITYGTNPLDSDTDADGLSDSEELEFGTDPLLKDTDGDGLLDAEQIYTRTLKITDKAGCYDPNVYPTLTFTSDIKNILSVTMDEYENDFFLNSSMVGYIGSGYTFTSAHDFESAILTFTLDEAFFEENNFTPAIYYLNESTQMLEELQNQTISANTISAEITHFSTYIVLNKRKLQDVWENDIDVIPTANAEIVFVLDYSTSLDNNDPQGYRIDVAKDFVNNLDTGDKAGVVAFNSSTKTVALTSDKGTVKSGIEIARTTSGSTEIWNGLEVGYNLFDDKKEANTNRYVILMTDGWNNTTSSYPSKTKETCDLLREQKQIDRIFVIGLGRYSCNSSLLRSVADNDSYYELTTSSDPDSFFRSTYSSIGSDVEELRGKSGEDLNNDGIDDYYAEQMCKGYMLDGTFGYVFGDNYGDWQSLFQKVQESDDFDEDGLKNGEEVRIVIESTGRPIAICDSDPTTAFTDDDKYSDKYEVKNLGTDPKVTESVYWDYDIDTLVDFDYLSDDYYERITGSPVLMGAAAIGNYCYGGKTDLTQIYRETIYDYIIYLHTGNTKAHDQESKFDLVLEKFDSCLEKYDALWNHIKGGLPQYVTDAYIEAILPRYNDMKEGRALLKEYGKDIPDDIAEEFDELIEDSAERYAKFVDDYDILNVEKQIKLNKLSKISKYIGAAGNVITVVSCGKDNIKFYLQLYDSVAFLEESKSTLALIADDAMMYDPLLAAAAKEMLNFVENESDRIFQLAGITILRAASATGEVFLNSICQEAMSVLLKDGYGAAIFLGYTIGTFLGDKITPVSARSEFAVRVCAMTVISKITADDAAGLTRYTINHTPDRRTDNRGMVFGVWKTNSESGQLMHDSFIAAIYARMYAEQSVIDLLSEDTEGLKSAYAFLEGFVYYLIDEWGNDVYTHDKYDIIADCASKQNTLMTLRNKYAI